MTKKDYEMKTEELITPIIEEKHFELVDVEWVKEGSNRILRVYIDKPGGITVDDCELVSREFNEILDREDYISENYVFEVSSPGLTRPLKKDKDLARSIGRDVEFKLFKAVDKQKEFEGTLKAFDDKTITVVIDEKEASFDRDNIAMIRLAFRF